jgi:hypothetical protein
VVISTVGAKSLALAALSTGVSFRPDCSFALSNGELLMITAFAERYFFMTGYLAMVWSNRSRG